MCLSLSICLSQMCGAATFSLLSLKFEEGKIVGKQGEEVD